MSKQLISNQKELDSALHEGKLTEIYLGDGVFEIQSSGSTLTTFIGNKKTTILLKGDYTDGSKFLDEDYKAYVFDAAFIYFKNATITASKTTEIVFACTEWMEETLKKWNNIVFDYDKFEIINLEHESEEALEEFEDVAKAGKHFFKRYYQG